MAKLKLALAELYELEFPNPSRALHKNKGELGLTFMGVYQTAHPKWRGWEIITPIVNKLGGDIKKASKVLYSNQELRELVYRFYEKVFWKKMKLHKVESQKIAEEIFIFGVNAGKRTAIRKAQVLVGVVPDGIIGNQTLGALNKFDENVFDMKFDEIEIKYYDYLISKKPSFKVFKNGWHNRAMAV